MKAKKLKQALQELSEEGATQVFLPTDGSALLVGVVGPLQLDVLKARLAAEYGLEIDWSTPEFQFARWIAAGERKMLDRFVTRYPASIAEDSDGDLCLSGAQHLRSRIYRQTQRGYCLFRCERHSSARSA
jgi:peptide chain release factor 3